MTSSKEYTNNELNYFRICDVTANVLPRSLRTVFTQEWDARYQASHGPWTNCSKNATDFYNGESKANKKRLDKDPLKIVKNGNIDEWDCTCLFFAILNSTSIGLSLGASLKKSIESLRNFRNKCFAHKPVGSVSDSDFESSIQDVIQAFRDLGLDTSEVEKIKNETTFATQELNAIKKQLEKEKGAKEKLEKENKSLQEEINTKTESFCSLPPKPSHETLRRKNYVSAVLQKMEEMEKGGKDEVSVVYLSGNPGCGKSQLAAQVGEATYQKNEKMGAIFVMTLDSKNEDTLLNSYIEFARLLRCPELSLSNCQSECKTKDEKLNFLQSLVMSKARRFFHWLLIIDNVANIKLLSKYWPQPGAKEWGKGQVIVTTQDSHSVPLSYSRSYHVSLKHGMDPSDACQLLFKICNVPIDNSAKAPELVMKLDYQPLAIACAALYIKYTGISFNKYLEKLLDGERETTEEVLESVDLTYRKTMTYAVKLAVEKEMKNEEIMKHAFQFLSLLAAEKVALQYVARYVLLQLPKADESVIKCKIQNSSLVLNVESDEIKVHQIVHSVFKENFQPVVTSSLACVLAFKPLVEYNLQNVDVLVATRSLVPHFCCLLNTVENLLREAVNNTPNLQYDDIGNCISVIGTICWRHGQFKQANQYYQKDLIIKRSLYNDNHSKVAESLNNLGKVCNDLGQHEQAKEFCQRAFAISQAVYGDNHPDVAKSLNVLGVVCSNLDQHEQAKDFYQRALAISQAVYGDNHPFVATSLNGLGVVCSNLGQHEQAKDFYQRALAVSQAVCGDNHPDVATSLNNLGRVYSDLGQHEQAKDFNQRALAIRQAVYGDNHPDVAKSLNVLGVVCNNLAQHEQAKDFYERVLAISQAVYGDNHPDVATLLNVLGVVFSKLRQPEQAKDFYQRALAIRQAVYGDNHPDVARSLNNLGLVCSKLGQHEQAKDFCQRALAIRQAVYGDNHRDVAKSLNVLGVVCSNVGQHEQAKDFYQRALAISQAVYDDNHPDVAKSLNGLGGVCSNLRQHEQAKDFYQRPQAVYGDNQPFKTDSSRRFSCLLV